MEVFCLLSAGYADFTLFPFKECDGNRVGCWRIVGRLKTCKVDRNRFQKPWEKGAAQREMDLGC